MTELQLLTGEQKQQQWIELANWIQRLLKGGPPALRALSEDQLTRLINMYQSLIADLARARSLDASPQTIFHLNRIAVAGHNLLYGQLKRKRWDRSGSRTSWFAAFAVAVRRSLWAVLLSAALFFGPAIGVYVTIYMHPELAYDLVPEEFYNFNPTSEEHMHEIPSLARPIASSGIMTNNVQVTLLAFGFGLTLGLGTTLILVFNGIHLGAIAAWLSMNGKGWGLWGWIMPHGATELLAITLAGAAGFLLAGAILSPGQFSRSAALKRIGGRALVIELGCMVMLVFAGLIEGFVSPSSIGRAARIAILLISLVIWLTYFLFAGLGTSGKAE